MNAKELAESAALLEAGAVAAANRYYGLMVRHGLGRYPGKSVKSLSTFRNFRLMAAKCAEAGVAVEDFVDAAFLRVMDAFPVVTPRRIADLSPRDVLRSRDAEVASRPAPKDLWAMMSCKLMDMVFGGTAPKGKAAVLMDPMYGFPAWFRVFAPEAPVPDLVVAWGILASEELIEDRELDAFLERTRPATHALLKSVMNEVSEEDR